MVIVARQGLRQYPLTGFNHVINRESGSKTEGRGRLRLYCINGMKLPRQLILDLLSGYPSYGVIDLKCR